MLIDFVSLILIHLIAIDNHGGRGDGGHVHFMHIFQRVDVDQRLGGFGDESNLLETLY